MTNNCKNTFHNFVLRNNKISMKCINNAKRTVSKLKASLCQTILKTIDVYVSNNRIAVPFMHWVLLKIIIYKSTLYFFSIFDKWLNFPSSTNSINIISIKDELVENSWNIKKKCNIKTKKNGLRTMKNDLKKWRHW